MPVPGGTLCGIHGSLQECDCEELRSLIEKGGADPDQVRKPFADMHSCLQGLETMPGVL